MPRPIRLLDGKTEYPFATKPVGPWPALTGTVVVALPIAICGYDLAESEIKAKVRSGLLSAEAAAAKLVDLDAEFYAKHLKAWNVPGVGVSAAALKALPIDVFHQLGKIVKGGAGVLMDEPESAANGGQ